MVKQLPISEFVHLKYSNSETVVFFRDPSCYINNQIFDRIRHIFCYYSAQRCVYFNWDDYLDIYKLKTLKSKWAVFILGNETIRNVIINPNCSEIDELFKSIKIDTLPLSKVQRISEKKFLSSKFENNKLRPKTKILPSESLCLPRCRNSKYSCNISNKMAFAQKTRKMVNKTHKSLQYHSEKCISDSSYDLSLGMDNIHQMCSLKSLKVVVKRLEF